jgi:tetratricopeptide (TPR) repeat protein
MACAQSPEATLQESLSKARAEYNKQHYRDAEQILRGALQKAPGSLAATEMLGLVLAAEGEYAAARKYFEAVVRAEPASAAAVANLAADLAQLHENVLAEAEFRNALKLDPADYDVNHNLGELYLQLGRIAEAIPLLQQAQKARPSSYANGYDLALAQFRAGHYPEAEAQVQSLARAADQAELHSLLAEIYEKQAKFVQAAAEYERAARMEPSEANIFEWGNELLRHQTPEPAIEVLGWGARLHPRSWRMQVGLGVSLFLHEDYEPAVQRYCAAIDLDPSDSRTYRFLAAVNPLPPALTSEALARFQRYAEAQRQDSQALLYYATALWNATTADGNSQSAAQVEALLRRALDLDPKLAEAHLQMGILYASRDMQAEAGQQFTLATKLKPNLALAHYKLSQTLLRLGDRAHARQEAEIWKSVRTSEREEQEKERAQLMRFVYGANPELKQAR